MPTEAHSKKQQHLTNLRRATRVARNSILIIVALAILKGVGGYVTNIVSLTGDAIGSMTDVISNIAIFVGLKLSQHKASEGFKYGYHRLETLISLFISILIIYLGYQIAHESFDRLLHPAQTMQHELGIIAATISIFASLFAFVYQQKTALAINSKALLASAYDKRNDVLVSIGVLASIFADLYKVPYVESIIGFTIAGLILLTGFTYAKDAILYLLDYWDNPEVTRQIRAIIKKSRIVTGIKNVRLRHAGTYIFGEVFLEVNAFTDAKDLRDELHRLDREIEDNVEHIGDIVIYIDPPKPTTMYVAIPIVEDKGMESTIAENALQHFRFFFVEVMGNVVKHAKSDPREFTIQQSAEIAHFLKEKKTNILISSLITPVLYYNLRLNNIKVYPHFLDVKDVKNTVKLLLLDM